MYRIKIALQLILFGNLELVYLSIFSILHYFLLCIIWFPINNDWDIDGTSTLKEIEETSGFVACDAKD